MRVLLSLRPAAPRGSRNGTLKRPSSFRRSAAVRVLAVAASCLCVLGVLGATGCQEPPPEPDTPAGSLRMLAEAAEKGEWGTMLVYMDPIQVGNSFAEATIARLDDEPEDGAPDSGTGSHSGGAFTASPMITGFTDAFMTNFQANVDSGSVLADGKLLRVILDDGVGESEPVSDAEVLVSVEMPGDDAQSVMLRMVRDADHWKLVSVEGTTDLYGLLF